MTDTERERINAICEVAGVTEIDDLSDGFHTFRQLYYQRMMLFAAIVRQNKDKEWKSLRHEDGELCFGGGWFIVGIDTPEGSYTYHYENKYFDLFDCEILDYSKHWDGHTEKDVTRLLSLPKEQLFCEDTTEGTTSDTISRQAARHALCKAVHKDEDIPCNNQTGSCLWTGTRVCDYVREIDALPSVQPDLQPTCNQLATDTISRQAAIDRFNVIRPVDPKKDEYTKGIDVGIAMCIVAVKDQPTIQSQSTAGQLNDSAQSTDLIDRQAALEMVRTMQTYKLFMGDDMILIDKADVQTELMMLPSVQPEHKVRFADKDHVWIDGKQYISLPRFQEAVKEAQPKEGHWIQYEKRFPWRFHYKCSECGNYLDFSGVNGGRGKANYCPNCGAKMKGETK